jgi:hypothetical protein
MKDPIYAGLLFQIESQLSQVDEVAQSKGVQLTDSQVKSALIKAQKKLQGGTPAIPQTNDREKLLAGLIDSLRDTTVDQHLWANALETVVGSIKTRTGNIPGSRDYLEFVQGFIRSAKGLN